MSNYIEIAKHIGTTEGQCILLLGPELSVNQSGKYYKSFFKELTAKNPNCIVQYFENENIFSFVDQSGTDVMIEPIREFYSNVGDETLLELIATIKFPLVINVCPDKSLNKVFNSFYKYKEGIDYFYYYRYRGSNGKVSQKPSKERPIIYNMFGDWQVYDTLIYNHKTFYDAIEHLLSKESIPGNIQGFLNKANSYVFLGFDFESWHYHLMCHKLGLGASAIKKSYGSKHSTADKNSVKIIMKDYFKVNFVDENPTHTIHEIIKACERICPESLRTPKTNKKNYSVYISYAWSDKKVDMLELIYCILFNSNEEKDQKLNQIKNLIVKSGKKIPENEDLSWLLNDETNGRRETVAEWYEKINVIYDSQPEYQSKQCNREFIVEKIEQKLINADIKVFRDRNEITYGDSIESFMNRIGKGKVVIRVVSDKYLKSRYCMDEALRIKQYSNSDKRIFTVVLMDDVKFIGQQFQLNDDNNIEYKKYWETLVQNIYGKIDSTIASQIDRERVKRYYSIYIDIYDYIIEFVKSIQDEVNLQLSGNGNTSCLPIESHDKLSQEDEKKLNDFIKVIKEKLEMN